jgi:hypothetical protein
LRPGSSDNATRQGCADGPGQRGGILPDGRAGGRRLNIPDTPEPNPHVAAAISRNPETAWTAIRYPDTFVDPDTGELVSDAEVAEVEYTAFTGRRKAEHATARLIVRRVRRLGAEVAADGRAEEQAVAFGVLAR